MTSTREWRPGDRVVLAGAPGELARLDGVRATVVTGGEVPVVRFDSAKLLAGRLRLEVAVGSAFLLDEPARPGDAPVDGSAHR
jgi:hypothetical protein